MNPLVLLICSTLIIEGIRLRTSSSCGTCQNNIPCKMRKHRVDGASYNFSVDGAELFNTVTEGNDFSRAHKGTGEQNVFSMIIYGARVTSNNNNNNNNK